MKNQTNLALCNIVLSVDQSKFIESYSRNLEIFVCLPTGVMGTILNILAMIVLLMPTMHNSFFNRLLVCLAAYDITFALCDISEVSRQQFRLSILQDHFFVDIVYGIRSISMCCSIYTTVALAFDRHQALSFPVEYQNRQTIQSFRRLFKFMGGGLLFSVIFNLPKFLDLKVEEEMTCSNLTGTNTTGINITTYERNCTAQSKVIPTELRTNYQYVFWYINILNIAVTGVLPISLLIYLNFRIYLSFKRFIQWRASRTSNKNTVIMFSIVILFVVCHTPRIALNLNEFASLERTMEERRKGCYDDSFLVQVALSISRLLLLINSTTNFFFYIFFDKGFRKAIKGYLCSTEDQSRQLDAFEMQ